MSYHAKFQQDKEGIPCLSLWADTPEQGKRLREFLGIDRKVIPMHRGTGVVSLYLEENMERKWSEPIVEGHPPDFEPPAPVTDAFPIRDGEHLDGVGTNE